MKPLGLTGTYEAIRSANGPAQHIAASLVGLTYAGMFVDMVPDVVLISWAAASVLVLASTIWLRRQWLKRFLLLDFTLSCMVLTFYFLHEPPAPDFVYHTMTATGMTSHSIGAHTMSMLDMFSHAVACVMMAAWSLYLSNLVHRQILEAERYEIVFEGEVLK